MAEFQEVLRQWRRMCNCHSCDDCPGGATDDEDTICMLITTENQRTEANVEHIITQWAAEHPEPIYPTWAEYLMHTYQDISYARILGETIPADIAQKLGLKPKEG